MAEYTPITIDKLQAINNLQNTDKLLVSRGTDTKYTTGSLTLDALSSQMYTIVENEFSKQQQQLAGIIIDSWSATTDNKHVASARLTLDTKNQVAKCLDKTITTAQTVKGSVNFSANPTTDGTNFSSKSLVTQNYVASNYMPKSSEMLVFSCVLNGNYNQVTKDFEIPLHLFIDTKVNATFKIYVNYLFNYSSTTTKYQPKPMIGSTAMTKDYGEDYINKDHPLSKYSGSVVTKTTDSEMTHKMKIFNSAIDVKYVNAAISIFKLI